MTQGLNSTTWRNLACLTGVVAIFFAIAGRPALATGSYGDDPVVLEVEVDFLNQQLILYGKGFGGEPSVSLAGEPLTVVSSDGTTIVADCPLYQDGNGTEVTTTETEGVTEETVEVVTEPYPLCPAGDFLLKVSVETDDYYKFKPIIRAVTYDLTIGDNVQLVPYDEFVNTTDELYEKIQVLFKKAEVLFKKDDDQQVAIGLLTLGLGNLKDRVDGLEDRVENQGVAITLLNTGFNNLKARVDGHDGAIQSLQDLLAALQTQANNNQNAIQSLSGMLTDHKVESAQMFQEIDEKIGHLYEKLADLEPNHHWPWW